MKFNARLLLAGALGWCACLILLVGCQKNTAEAVARNSKSKPVFGTGGSSGGEKKSLKPSSSANMPPSRNFSFLHPDHFACLSIDVQRIIARKELKEFPWDSVEVQLADLVGNANADLNLIERIWLLLDLSLIHISEPTRPRLSRMPSSA